MSKSFLLSTPIVLLCAGAPAQLPPASAPSGTTADDSITLKGCVAESMGRYMLNQASIVKPVPTPVPAAASAPTREPRSDDQVYELVGSELKAHVGHQIEVVGTMPPMAATGNAQPSEDRTRTAHPMAGTVHVKKVTMLASTCR